MGEGYFPICDMLDNILTKEEFIKKVSSLYVIYKGMPPNKQKSLLQSLNNNNYVHVFNDKKFDIEKFAITHDNQYFYYTINLKNKKKHIVLNSKVLPILYNNIKHLKNNHLKNIGIN